MLKFILLVALFSCSQLQPKRPEGLSIIQGVTGPKEVEFSVVARSNLPLRFELRSAEGEIIAPEEVTMVTRDHSQYAVHKLLFARESSKEYNFYAFSAETLVDQRLVGKGPQNPSKLKMAVVSCMNDFEPKHFKIWDVLARQNPDYLLMIGDNVYADKALGKQTLKVNPDRIWDRYIEVRLTLPIFFQSKLIPIHALWDDHDYGMNDGNSKYEFQKESKEIFETMYAQNLAEENWSKSFGVGGLLSLGDFNLYFLDGRSFRAPTPDGRHLGLDQHSWLMNKLKEEASPSFLIKGDQFFGGYHSKDSFEGKHPQDFAFFTTELNKSPAPFIFVSGDRHLSEIMQFPRGLFVRPSFEITSSPMHTDVSNEMETNPWRVVGHKSGPNFVTIDSAAEDDHWFLTVMSLGENGEMYFKRELAVFIKDLQNNLNEARKKRHGKRRYRRYRGRR